MKKTKITKLNNQVFILIAFLITLATIFFFSLPKINQNKSFEVTEEFNKEINNIYSFFFNKKNTQNNKKIIKIKSGDSFQKILANEQIPQVEINKIYSAIVKKIDLKKIQQGQLVQMVF